jgi:hypothetical protein
MNEANRPIVGDGIDSILLWNQHNVCGIEPIEVLQMRLEKRNIIFMGSSLITFQQDLQNKDVNPSRPGALAEGKSLIASWTSFSVNSLAA